MMGLFGKRRGDVPPDVGQEEKYDADKGLAEKPGNDKLEKIDAKDSVPQEIAREAKPVAGGVSAVGLSNVQIESINARTDSIVEWIKQFYERFSYVSESIGEIRTIAMVNEKRISEEVKEANKVIDVVREVKPEELRISYQKSDMKIVTLAEKIEANKLFMDEVMKEMNDLRRKSEVFIGTEGLMNLNNDTKKDLVEIQKINSRVRMQADKAQEIFMELRKGFAESQKVGAIVGNLDESYSGLKESIEKLGIDYGNIVKRSDYLDFKKTYGNKLALFDSSISDIGKMKQDLSQMGDLIETSLSVGRRNEEDIGNIGLKVGADDVKKVSDYENQMIEVIGIIETFSEQLAEVRKKVGLRATKLPEVMCNREQVIGKPSEKDDVVKRVVAVKVPEVPKLKPDKFLGKKNIVAKQAEVDMEATEKKIEKTVGDLQVKKIVKVKPKGVIGGMIKKVVTNVGLDKADVEENGAEVVEKIKTKIKKKVIYKKKGSRKKKGFKK